MLNTYINELQYSAHPKNILDICSNFADLMLEKKSRFVWMQSNRNIYSPDAYWNQVYNGKVAEFYVASYCFQVLHLPYIKPDIIIYETNQCIAKGFDGDLCYPRPININLHVKSYRDYCSGRYPESYMFQPEDPLIAPGSPVEQPSPYSSPMSTPQPESPSNGLPSPYSSSPENHVALVVVEPTRAALRAIVPVGSVIPLLRAPIKKTLYKKTLYAEDLARSHSNEDCSFIGAAHN